MKIRFLNSYNISRWVSDGIFIKNINKTQEYIITWTERNTKGFLENHSQNYENHYFPNPLKNREANSVFFFFSLHTVLYSESERKLLYRLNIKFHLRKTENAWTRWMP